MKAENNSIRNEEAIQHLLSRIPENIRNTFTDEQLIGLKAALGGRNFGNHGIDIRKTFFIPFTTWCFYLVFLVGKNRRRLSDTEIRASFLFTAIIAFLTLVVFLLIVLLILYLLKSYAGLDIFPGFSLGIWDYFRDNVFN